MVEAELGRFKIQLLAPIQEFLSNMGIAEKQIKQVREEVNRSDKEETPKMKNKAKLWKDVGTAAVGAIGSLYAITILRSPAVQTHLQGIGMAFEFLGFAMGEIAAPVFAEVEDIVSGLTDKFFELPEPVQKTITITVLAAGAFVALAAVAAIVVASIAAIGATAAIVIGAIVLLGGAFIYLRTQGESLSNWFRTSPIGGIVLGALAGGALGIVGGPAGIAVGAGLGGLAGGISLGIESMIAPKKMQGGGMVVSPTLALLHPGERVIPSNSVSSSQQSIVFSPTINIGGGYGTTDIVRGRNLATDITDKLRYDFISLINTTRF